MTKFSGARLVQRDQILLTRRTLCGLAAAHTALRAVDLVSARLPRPTVANTAGQWRTWLLASGAELRPSPPATPTEAEADELLTFQSVRTDAMRERIAYWGDRSAVLPWTDLALDLIKEHKPSPVRAGRILALMHTAVADAVVATWDAKTSHPRPVPAATVAGLEPLTVVAGETSFPSEHAAVAGAAATILTNLFPERQAQLEALADGAATSRLWAGTNFRSDVESGLALGRAVGERAVHWAGADKSDAAWDRSRLTGEGTWQPTPPAFRPDPLDPLAGTWRTWVLERGDALRPAPPPVWDSAGWQAELLAVQQAVAGRTPEQEAAVFFWAGGEGTVTPAGLWIEIARDLIARNQFSLPHAARALALTSVAMYDAFVCCWDAKYAYWSARPITADPNLAVLIPTPPFPSYTSGHSTISAAAATVLGYLFPDDRSALAEMAREAKDSRLWAGIHFPLDNDMGALGGALIGRLLVARALEDHNVQPSTRHW
jgi:membrane-associated phospholipid phosphatase